MSSGAMAAPARVLIEIENLHKTFGTGEGRIEVLRGVDMKLSAGDRVAIVGQSGVGKSTFLHILGTLDHPTSGSVRFEGEEVFEKTPEQLARLRNRFLGFVFQFHHLLPEFSAAENVMMPGLIQGRSRDEMRERARRILGEVELGHRLDHPVGKLSGGERQRVAVARALVLEPPVVLADEPTGNLDERATRGVYQLLRDINDAGTVVLMATHNLELVRASGKRILELRDGTLVFDSAGEPGAGA